MSGLNVAEWTPDQVADWLSGLGPSVAQYVPALKARGLDGKRLLMLRCDDLEYLGVHVIGHQELLLEAVEHLRNFQYELSRECIQQLAMRVCVLATNVSRALRGHSDARLDTSILADVGRAVHAVKPLVCWLDRWAGSGAPPGLGARRAALLRLALEAATCAQRDRFAEQPARAVAAAAAGAALAATHLARDLPDPAVLQPATLDTVTLRQAGKPLGFEAVPSFCGRHQLADVRFGSPAHASGAVHEGDEIVAVGGRCVVGWAGGAVRAACAAAARGGELALRLRRRAARPLRLPPRHPPPCPHPPDSDDDSGPLSPPASPTHLNPDRPRIFPPKPPALVQRRHTISCGSPVSKRPSHTVEQFWQQLRAAGLGAAAEAGLGARDKAASSGGLRAAAGGDSRSRLCLAHRLDKSHSTPAYDAARAAPPAAPAPPPHPQLVVHSAEKADQILEFKKSSSQIEEALQQRRAPEPASDGEVGPEGPRPVETVNVSLVSRRRSLRAARAAGNDSPSSMSRACGVPAGGGRRPGPSPPLHSPPSPPPRPHPHHPPQGSGPVRHITKQDIRVIPSEAGRRPLPALNSPPAPPPPAAPPALPASPQALSPTSAVRGIFPTSKSRSLKKKSSILAKRRGVCAASAAARGLAAGGAWQRVRGAAGAARWAARLLVLAQGALFAFRRADSPRAACRVLLPGCTVAPAREVRSRDHCFKVYHTGSAAYFACATRDDMLAWMQLLHRATLLPPMQHVDASKQFSETEYSDSETDDERPEDSKFDSLKKLTVREAAPSHSTSLDRKYLRFFSRNKNKDEHKPKSKSSASATTAEEYRSFRRDATSTPALHHIDLMPQSSNIKEKASVRGVTLEQFMLQQAEGRVTHTHTQRLVTDVYGDVGSVERSTFTKSKDGFEKIVHPPEKREQRAPSPPGDPSAPPDPAAPPAALPAPPAAGECATWGREGLRRNDRVHTRSPHTTNHSWSNAGTSVTGGPGVSKLRLIFGEQRQAAKYPHLQCPPTFEPETYSLRAPPH